MPKKYVLQYTTGLNETSVFEGDSAEDYREAIKEFDRRSAETNQKIVEVREFMANIKDPNYRYLFVTFFDQFLGISSQAEPLGQKFKVDAPIGFDEWMRKNERLVQPVKK